MTIYYDPIKLGIIPCTCGRLSNKIHCPRCGSYSTIGRAAISKRLIPETGETKEFVSFKCRLCNHFFDAYDWQNDCQAPLWESKTTKQLKELEASSKRVAERTISQIDDSQDKNQKILNDAAQKLKARVLAEKGIKNA